MKTTLLLLFAIFCFSGVNSCANNEPSRGYPCAKIKKTWRQPHGHHWRDHKHHHKNPDSVFEIVQKHIDLEAALQDQCLKNGNNLVYEVYDFEKYVLKYNISEYKNSNISVKIFNRLINIDAKKTDEGGKTQVFQDVKLLPDILNYENANWFFENELLQINIPYKITFGNNIVKECGSLNRNVIDVPTLNYDIDLRIAF
ncbi:unnamed protein product [Euphydryas editha]|uniref:Uncharacterized protein n=1 Tax=Euphydryas editha TaxID=104508 RepID=A0AAU9URC7_EUPED|nr:unnamed protein product [Euphydryas editha]